MVDGNWFGLWNREKLLNRIYRGLPPIPTMETHNHESPKKERGMGGSPRRKKRTYNPEERCEAIARVLSGVKPKDVAVMFDIPVGTVGSWFSGYKSGRIGDDGHYNDDPDLTRGESLSGTQLPLIELEGNTSGDPEFLKKLNLSVEDAKVEFAKTAEALDKAGKALDDLRALRETYQRVIHGGDLII